ncbi:MAG: hypothetical protein AAFV01_13835, partial [Bacteroidota bacterium]
SEALQVGPGRLLNRDGERKVEVVSHDARDLRSRRRVVALGFRECVGIQVVAQLDAERAGGRATVRDNEPEKYRFFYTPGGGAARRLMVSDLDLDREGDELGATFAVTVSDGSTTTGTFRVKLRNYLDPDTLPEAKRDDTATAPEVPGVVGNDLNFTFPVTIQ